MDKADIEKFRRIGGLGETIEIGTEKFYFKPLPLKHLPELMDFSRITQEEGDKALMKKENATRLFNIMQTFVLHSYPALGEEQDLLDNFILNNMAQLQEVLIKTSTPKSGGDLSDKQKTALEALKDAQNKQ